MENTIYLSSAYLAPVEYYTKLFACEKAYVEQYDNYVKQTYRNRCVIAAADGPLALTIPTEKSGTPKCLMKDVRISDHGNWRHIHWTGVKRMLTFALNLTIKFLMPNTVFCRI